MLGSARATNEDNYITQKFARVVLGTNNVDSCARVCHAPSAAALGTMLGTGAATNSFDDVEQARTIVVCGSNATENHPIVGARIKQAVLGGANLVVIDPKSIELTDYADVHLHVRPGTNVALLNAIACVIVDEDLVDRSFLAERVDGLDEFRAFIEEFTPEAVASICGVDPEHIRHAARLYAGETPAISFHGLGMTEHRHGTDMVTALVNLALLTGNIGKPGAGVNPLRGQNNVQGAAHVGCVPDRLTSYVPIDEGRNAFATVRGAAVPSERGLDAMQMVHAASEGTLKGLWVIGWDILLTNPDTQSTERALANLDLVVVQDLFLNETAREIGTVFLPACSTFERDGTFMNSEGRIQRVRAAIDPLGESRPDWEALCLAAAAMGHRTRFPYSSVQEVWDEIRQVWPAGAGISYERLDRERGLQWPCLDEDDPGTQILHTDSFPRIGKRATLAPVPYLPSGDTTTDQFPFVLVTGRGLYQFNAGTMTARTPNATLRPTDTLEISTADARRLGITDGQRVRVRSRYGAIDLAAEITDRVRPGELFATFSDPASRVNRVTGPYQDTHTRTPEYKVTAVNVDRGDYGP
jgi:formate dehydrogenase major subunit